MIYPYAIDLTTKKRFMKSHYSAFNINLLKLSTTIVKTKGKGNTPCLKPINALIHPLACSLINITNLVVDIFFIGKNKQLN